MISTSIASLINLALVSPVPATLQDLNAMAEVLNCSGSIVSLGRDDSKRAVILTAGHCARYPYLYKNGEAEAGIAIPSGPEKEKYASLFPPNASTQKPLKVALNNLYYGTLTKVDAALFETTNTLAELQAKGITPLTLADRLPKPGEKVKITSALWKQTQECEVEQILEDDAEERALFGNSKDSVYHFRNSILLSEGCGGEVGWSGAPLVNSATGQVLGVVSRVYSESDRISPAPFLRFTSWMASPVLAEKTYVVASNITDLKDCLTSDGKLLTEGFACSLPAPQVINTKPSRPKAPTQPKAETKQSSSWPSSKRAYRGLP